MQLHPRLHSLVVLLLFAAIGLALPASAQSATPAPLANAPSTEVTQTPTPATADLSADSQGSQVFYPSPSRTSDKSPSGHSSPVTTSVLYIILLAAMGWAAYTLWQKKNNPHGSPGTGTLHNIQIIATKPLGNRQYILSVRANGRDMVLGVGQEFITPLDNRPAITDSHQTKGPGFADLMGSESSSSSPSNDKDAPPCQK